jgi:hypothetical protein
MKAFPINDILQIQINYNHVIISVLKQINYNEFISSYKYRVFCNAYGSLLTLNSRKVEGEVILPRYCICISAIEPENTGNIMIEDLRNALTLIDFSVELIDSIAFKIKTGFETADEYDYHFHVIQAHTDESTTHVDYELNRYKLKKKFATILYKNEED